MEPLFEIKANTFPADGFVRLYVAGQLDLAVAPELEGAIRASAAWDESGTELILDLTNVTFIDSAGLAVIVRASSALAGRLSIVASPECMSLFEHTVLNWRVPLLISNS